MNAITGVRGKGSRQTRCPACYSSRYMTRNVNGTTYLNDYRVRSHLMGGDARYSMCATLRALWSNLSIKHYARVACLYPFCCDVINCGACRHGKTRLLLLNGSRTRGQREKRIIPIICSNTKNKYMFTIFQRVFQPLL